MAASTSSSRKPPITTPPPEVTVDQVYDGGLQGRWQDWGWAPRDTEVGHPARLNFAHNGGWVLVRRNLTGSFSSLTFYFIAPPKFGTFLEVHLANDNDGALPRVTVDAAHTKMTRNGWTSVHISLAELNPENRRFDRIIFRARAQVGEEWVNIDRVALLGSATDPGAVQAAIANASHEVSMQIDCGKATHIISPLIYGIAYNPRRNDPAQWVLSPTARRWGGSAATLYNWRLGNAWNAGHDWFFANVNYTQDPDFSWGSFFNENRRHAVQAALTIPMIGWVAKDSKSYSYPVAVFGPQQLTDKQNPDAGNGYNRRGQPLAGANPNRTSVAAPAEFISDWVRSIRRYDSSQDQPSVNTYILDNQPSLWNSSHRDVHPTPVTYDELLQRTLYYGHAIRQADPSAVIAGPAEWGWPAYFYSAKDAQAGFAQSPDRRNHDDKPLLAWYLESLRVYEERTGERLLNVLDVHYYPQGEGIYGSRERNDAATAEKRIRSTRSLWDASYVDESWINDRIRLLPRLHDLVADHYPGLQISIGEYNFGGEHSMSGALALADALGRFGQHNVYSAYYWTSPPENSSAFYAFRAFRNYDGAGAHFLSRGLVTQSEHNTSLFAATDDLGGKMTAILLNLDSRSAADANIDLLACGNVQGGRTFQFTSSSQGLHLIDTPSPKEGNNTVHQVLPPYSITVFELKLRRP